MQSKSSYYATLIFAAAFGCFGVDRFYTGNWFLGIVKFITCGFMGIWWLVDVVMLVMGSYHDGNGNAVTGNDWDERFEAQSGISLRVK